mgnify:CR=1 FL=1
MNKQEKQMMMMMMVIIIKKEEQAQSLNSRLVVNALTNRVTPTHHNDTQL